MAPASVPLDEAFHRSPNAYMILDRDLRYVMANEAYLRVTGSRLEDLIGHHVIDRFPNDASNPQDENARILRTSFEKVFATGERDHLPLIRYQVAREPGGPLEARFWSASHTPLVVEGEVAFVLQHTVEVTELVRIQGLTDPTGAHGSLSVLAAGILGRAELVQATNVSLDDRLRRLHAVFEQTPGFTAILGGPDHVFEVVNTAYTRVVGGRDVIGKSVRDALPDLAEQGFYELLDKVYSTGEVFVGRRVPVKLQQTPGGPTDDLVLDFVYQPILDAGGGVAGIFVQGNDVTQHARAEAERERLLEERSRLLQAEQAARLEAEQANRLKDGFLATVSHELRTPLTAISGWLELYEISDKSPERTARAMETIGRNTAALRQLVDDLLDVSRIVSGKLELEIAPVALCAPVEAAIEAVRPAALAKNIRLQHALDTKALVMGDAQRLQQIAWNLLVNAVKFTPKGGRVQILVERRDSTIALVVADTGQGIAAEFVPHVFERFRQAESSSTRSYGGLGLGLAIVKHLAERHGGTVHCASDGPGRGATFTVLLPVALSRNSPTPDKAFPSMPAIPQELVGLRILVLEDEQDTRELLVEILRGFQMEVTAAASVAEAIARFPDARPEVVLSDIGMPHEDGFSFIRWLRARPDPDERRTPAIALTAFARTEDRTAALRAGFRAHVPKPLDVAELVAVIASLVPERVA